MIRPRAYRHVPRFLQSQRPAPKLHLVPTDVVFLLAERRRKAAIAWLILLMVALVMLGAFLVVI